MLCSALSFGVRAFFGAKLMLAIDDCRLEMSERDSTAAAGSDDDDWWDGYSSSACPSLDDWERVGLTAWVPKSVATLALLYLLRRRRNAPQQVTQALRYGSGERASRAAPATTTPTTRRTRPPAPTTAATRALRRRLFFLFLLRSSPGTSRGANDAQRCSPYGRDPVHVFLGLVTACASREEVGSLKVCRHMPNTFIGDRGIEAEAESTGMSTSKQTQQAHNKKQRALAAAVRLLETTGVSHSRWVLAPAPSVILPQQLAALLLCLLLTAHSFTAAAVAGRRRRGAGLRRAELDYYSLPLIMIMMALAMPTTRSRATSTAVSSASARRGGHRRARGVLELVSKEQVATPQ